MEKQNSGTNGDRLLYWGQVSSKIESFYGNKKGDYLIKSEEIEPGIIAFDTEMGGFYTINNANPI